MPADKKRLPLRFFRTAAGGEPVREWLLELPKEDRTLIGEDLKTVEFGWPMGMPLCAYLGSGIWEVRINLKDRIARVLFCVFDKEMVLLHGIIKKTQKPPKDDLALARKRKKELEQEK